MKKLEVTKVKHDGGLTFVSFNSGFTVTVSTGPNGDPEVLSYGNTYRCVFNPGSEHYDAAVEAVAKFEHGEAH